MALSWTSPLTSGKAGGQDTSHGKGAHAFLTAFLSAQAPEDLTETCLTIDALDSSHRLSIVHNRCMVGSILGNTVYILDNQGRP